MNRRTYAALLPLLLLALGVACSSGAGAGSAATRAPVAVDDGWPAASPASLGLPDSPLSRLTEALRAGQEYPNVHAVLIAKDGRLVYEEYFAGDDVRRGHGPLGHVVFDRTTRHDLRSVTKSVVSALVGIAVASGAVSTDRSVYDFFPELAANATAERRGITVRHALEMTMGLEWNEDIPYTDPRNDEIRMNRSAEPMRIVLDRPLVAAPGTRWNYSGGSTQLLAEIVERTTRRRLEAFADSALWKPLGITDVEWIADSAGKASAASGLRMRPRDQLKIGQLYLDEGRWRGGEVLAADWVARSLAGAVALPDSLVDLREDATAVFGYGYQWRHGRFDMPYGRFTANWAQGNGGQFIFLIPQARLAAVVNAGNYNAASDGVRLFLERIAPWALGADSAYRLWTPRPFAYVADGQWPTVALTADERRRYVGVYDYDGKRVRVWDEGGMLHVTPLFGSEDGAIQLVPLGEHLFAYGHYANGRLAKVYWSNDRIEFRLENGRVVGFDDRAAGGSVYATAQRLPGG